MFAFMITSIRNQTQTNTLQNAPVSHESGTNLSCDLRTKSLMYSVHHLRWQGWVGQNYVRAASVAHMTLSPDRSDDTQHNVWPAEPAQNCFKYSNQIKFDPSRLLLRFTYTVFCSRKKNTQDSRAQSSYWQEAVAGEIMLLYVNMRTHSTLTPWCGLCCPIIDSTHSTKHIHTHSTQNAQSFSTVSRARRQWNQFIKEYAVSKHRTWT